jgi:tellurite methyltransferase
MTEWAEYHQKSVGLGPRPLLLHAIELFSEQGHAVDLGAGTGRDSVFLLSRGWTVLAIDTQQLALDRLRALVPAKFLSRCETRCAPMVLIVTEI